jgi:hypothetical protein
LLEIVENCKSLKYYYSEIEREEYLNIWRCKVEGPCSYYSVDEYKLYKEICIENRHYSYVHKYHYTDNGCSCVACSVKRKGIIEEINRDSNKIPEKIIHEKCMNEYKINLTNLIKTNLSKLNVRKVVRNNNNPKSIIRNNMFKSF